MLQSLPQKALILYGGFLKKKTVLCASGVNVNHRVSSRQPGCSFSVGVIPTQSNILVKDAGNERMTELSGKQALFKMTPGVHTFSI